jgi:hypothetical protein
VKVKSVRIPAAQDLPANAAELRAAVLREACRCSEVAHGKCEEHPTVRQFAALALAHVRAGGRAFCVHDVLGPVRAVAILNVAKSTDLHTGLRRHPGLVGFAQRFGAKLTATWGEGTKGKAA